jgi:hypothetical protein
MLSAVDLNFHICYSQATSATHETWRISTFSSFVKWLTFESIRASEWMWKKGLLISKAKKNHLGHSKTRGCEIQIAVDIK